MASGFYDELQRANRRATRLLLAGAVLLVAILVWIIAGWQLGPAVLDPVIGVSVTAIGTAVGILLAFLAYRSGPALALRANRARPVSRQDAPELHNLLDEVCVSAGMMGTKPKLHIVDDPAPNAFATGLRPEDSHVAVTTGLVEQLPRYELRAVLAHEVAHILNDDIRAVTVAVATVGVVALLADVMVRMLWWGGAARGGRGGGGRGGGRGGGAGAAQLIFMLLAIVAIILAPIAAQMIRFAVSRQREYLADATAADILRDPQSMANALRRIDQVPHTLRKFEAATAHLWFDEPNETRGKDRAAKMARRFATHPTIRERVERLATLNAGMVDIDNPLPPGPSAGSAAPSDPPPPPPGAPGGQGFPGFPGMPGGPAPPPGGAGGRPPGSAGGG